MVSGEVEEMLVGCSNNLALLLILLHEMWGLCGEGATDPWSCSATSAVDQY